MTVFRKYLLECESAIVHGIFTPQISQGILEFYAELLGRLPDSSVVRSMRLLARKNCPKGHEPCPCATGKLLRQCDSHRKLIYEIRERVAWQDVEDDLKVYLRGDKIK